ncbi:exodeoxyribonuclease VII small subunit [Kushneria phosphatilytica]|uniref:Exodeoxyribonuclease 7 small subunit n=1 Tax=Kushneria phosphatilytica TaxID=657387 RepID=A0A1S1NNQ4_9GAMM|nr:exodeoxyribonuclease VII small subunit [Kushneria phosphatilytica]OHV08957.1 exodeoxyribonuclease VII small subunit [Kushneria phosphatilytica]QEL09723.1 exodeoxyribonuclease VII small subunit [Kushneria phosphatilytica]
MTEQDHTTVPGDEHSGGDRDFAATLAELERLVEQLEGGELSLEASLGAFERGIRLTREAQTRLDQAELRVSRLLERSDATLEQAPDSATGYEGESTP